MSLIRQRRLRSGLLWLHRWLGFGLAAVLLIVGLSGSVLVFYPNLDRGLNPELNQVFACAPIAPEQALLRLQQQLPERVGSWRLEMPLATGLPYNARFMKPVETAGEGFAPMLVWLNPCNGEVLRTAFWGHTLMTWTYNLHYQLLAGSNGVLLLAIVALLALLMTVIGLLLWWPSGHWRKALRWRTSAHPAVSAWQRHVLVGFYSLPLWLLLLVTGLMLEKPDWFAPLIQQWSATRPLPMLTAHSVMDHSVLEPGSRVVLQPVSANQVLEQAYKRFPAAEVRWLESPADMMAPWQVRLYQDGEPSRRFPQTRVWIDPFSGQLLASRDPFEDTAGDTLLRWLYPLHSGEALGLFGRWLVLLTGLLPLWMLYSGWQRFWIKRQSRRASHYRSLRKD